MFVSVFIIAVCIHSGVNIETNTMLMNSTLLLDMLVSGKLTRQDKDFLKRFCEIGATRTKKIFDSKPHRDRLLTTVRNAPPPPPPPPIMQERRTDFGGERISSLEALFEDTLGDVPGDVKVRAVCIVTVIIPIHRISQYTI